MRPGTFLALALAVTGASACVRSNVVTCGDAAVCAEGLVCATVQGQDRCVTQGQIDACTSETCGTDPAVAAVCHDGVCFETGCGNRLVDPGEVCDDGNAIIGDACSSQCTSDETCGNGIVDLLLPTGDEACDDGNLYSHDGCTPGCIAETAVWEEVTPAGAPPGRELQAMAYDASRGRLVMFGGIGSNDRLLPENDLWESEGASWMPVVRARTPGRRRSHAMAYDPIRKRTVMFGGNAIAPLDDLWEWDGTAWASPAVVGPRPGARRGHAMAYVPARRAVVLVGGVTTGAKAEDVPFDDHWEWDGVAWTQLTNAIVPQGAVAASFAVDAKQGIGVLAATRESNVVETWHLSAAGWERRATTGLPIEARLAWDPISERVIAYGSSTGSEYLGTQSWDGTRWTRLPLATEPGQRQYPMLATHGRRGRVVLVGGRFGDGCAACGLLDDAREWTGTSWVRASFESPDPRAFFSVAYDPRRDRVLVLGGDAQVTQTSWLLDAGHSWTPQILPTSDRSFTPIAYDVKHDEAIGFGGLEGGPVDITVRWKAGQWQTVSVTGAKPSARYASSLSYDSERGTVLLFGGSGTAAELGDLWEWSGSTWSLRAASGPPGRTDAVMAYDPVRKHHVLMGGRRGITPLDDTWIWDGTSWTPSTSLVAPRFGAALAWDASRRALMLHGGFSTNDRPLGDTWEWTGAAWRIVPALDPPPARGGHVAWTASDGGIHIYGGEIVLQRTGADPGFQLATVHRLRFTTGAAPETCIMDTDTDGDGTAACDDADCWGTCTPLCSPGLTCPADAARCGDGMCEAPLESCEACPQDCLACPTLCGDGRCTDGETCPGDCGA